jgi:hypothetical protein
MVPPEQRPEDLLGGEPVFDAEEARHKREVAELEARIDPVDQALADFGIYAGYPAHRREQAAELLIDGMTVAQLQKLGRHIEKTTPAGVHAATRILAKTLSDPERWRPMLADIERFERAREGRQSEYATEPEAAPPRAFGEVIRSANMAKLEAKRAAAPEAAQRDRVVAHLRGEGWSVAKTAEVVGVAEALVRKIAAEEGIELHPARPIAALRRKPKEPSP